MNCMTTVRYWSEQYVVKTSVTLYAYGLSRMIDELISILSMCVRGRTITSNYQ
jgi:hypothetical protein